MLVELSVMEQRYQAVLAVVQDGWKVSEVAARVGVSRQTVHSWIRRYLAQGAGVAVGSLASSELVSPSDRPGDRSADLRDPPAASGVGAAFRALVLGL